MIAGPDTQRARAFLRIWWIIWAAALLGVGVIYGTLGFLKLEGSARHASLLLDLVGFPPLFLSIVIRWLVLPRYRDLRQAFPLFVAGLALAEACGLLGMFLGGPYRDDLILLGVLGIVQYAPFFARAYLEPKAQGFIPNN